MTAHEVSEGTLAELEAKAAARVRANGRDAPASSADIVLLVLAELRELRAAVAAAHALADEWDGTATTDQVTGSEYAADLRAALAGDTDPQEDDDE